MKISELQAKQGKVDVIVEVVSMEEPREFNKFDKVGKVCNAMVKDDSGVIKLTLWNDDVDKLKQGMKVHIINGYVNEWQGEKQLTTGKFGTMEIIEGSIKEHPKKEVHKTETKQESVKVEPKKEEPRVMMNFKQEDFDDDNDKNDNLDVEEEYI